MRQKAALKRIGRMSGVNSAMPIAAFSKALVKSSPSDTDS
jgi:hypothetical protein